jgi:hypothetical protein
MRLSDADREALISSLSRHAAEGRLELPELERRVEAIVAARTREEAAEVMADLPPLPAAAGESPRRGQSLWGRRGHGEAATAAPDWQPTGERFRDPKSGLVMRVWVDTGGGRHYVPDEGQ